MDWKTFGQGIIGIAVVAVLLGLLIIAQFGWAHVPLNAIFQSLIAVILALMAGTVLAMMMNGTINLQLLISEDNGNASLSRFQFLIFTFVIATSYFLLVIATLARQDASASSLPDLPAGVLGLIGLSGGSYVISKGIQKSSEGSQGLSITGITISAPGGGYAPNQVIPVTITGGGGTNAAGFATVGAGGTITDIKVSSPGSGYTSAPTVTIIAPPAGAGAAQATAIAVIG